MSELSEQQRERRERVRRGFVYCIFGAALTAAVLELMGRTWWCRCGSPVPWSWDIWSSHNSQHLMDPYTLSHVLHGMLFFAALYVIPTHIINQTKFLIAVSLEAAWEILENSPVIIDRYRTATISLDYYGDTIANSVFDIVACGLGYWLASSVRWYWSVATIAAAELIMLVTIRDCLTLNVVMLVCPIEAIKQWQTP